MKFPLSLLAGPALIILPAVAAAEAGWTDYAAIAELVPTARPYYEVHLEVKQNPSGCRNSSWFYQDYGLRGSDKMFDTLLEAVQSGKRVRLYVTGKCNLNGYSDFSAVGILP
ncbi:MAG TPA: hypothetical protein ENN06_05670 [Desulfobacteraceae bacterium]|nr:hypothetical protein [Desulfobacteraceae bacterium]